MAEIYLSVVVAVFTLSEQIILLQFWLHEKFICVHDSSTWWQFAIVATHPFALDTVNTLIHDCKQENQSATWVQRGLKRRGRKLFFFRQTAASFVQRRLWLRAPIIYGCSKFYFAPNLSQNGTPLICIFGQTFSHTPKFRGLFPSCPPTHLPRCHCLGSQTCLLWDAKMSQFWGLVLMYW